MKNFSDKCVQQFLKGILEKIAGFSSEKINWKIFYICLKCVSVCKPPSKKKTKEKREKKKRNQTKPKKKRV